MSGAVETIELAILITLPGTQSLSISESAGTESGFNDPLDAIADNGRDRKPVRWYHHIASLMATRGCLSEVDELRRARLVGKLLSGRLHHARRGYRRR